MKVIESPYAVIALRKMAEIDPQRLLRMEKEEPEKLLWEIERRVTNALGWTDTAIGKGADKAKMGEMMELLLQPDAPSTKAEPVQLSEHQIIEIHQKLMALER